MGTFYRSRPELIFGFKLGDAPHIYEGTCGGCARTHMISTLPSGEGSRAIEASNRLASAPPPQSARCRSR
jgi:hypothetical protein